jgi:DNA repair protein RecO (recombination protein O)
MHSYRTEGIVIKRKDFQEADRILTVFTRYQGKINIVAKGVRRIKSRRSPHVELLNQSILNIYEARMPILTEAETIYHYSLIKNDLKRAGYAFYICELLDSLLAERQESREIYDLTQKTLLKLEREEDIKILISKFQQELLISLGFWPRKQIAIEDSDAFIEEIIEKKIKTRRILNLI